MFFYIISPEIDDTFHISVGFLLVCEPPTFSFLDHLKYPRTRFIFPGHFSMQSRQIVADVLTNVLSVWFFLQGERQDLDAAEERNAQVQLEKAKVCLH